VGTLYVLVTEGKERVGQPHVLSFHG
jgi:hypothetical protein